LQGSLWLLSLAKPATLNQFTGVPFSENYRRITTHLHNSQAKNQFKSSFYLKYSLILPALAVGQAESSA